jgi:hypothetical protein
MSAPVPRSPARSEAPSPRRLTLALALLFVLSPELPAQAPEDALPVLELELGARPAALGGAFTAIPGSPQALFYNPAGLGTMERTALALDFQRRYEAIDIFSAATGIRLPRGTLGIGMIYVDNGDVEEEQDFQLTGRRPSSYDVAFLGAYALSLVEGLSLGATGRILRSEVADQFGATSVSADLGLLLDELFGGLSLGVALRNLGQGVQLEGATRRDPLPLLLRFGGSLRLGKPAAGPQFLLAADLVKPRDDHVLMSVGSEVSYQIPEGGTLESLSGRAGYHGSGGPSDDLGNLTFGIGFRMSAAEVDYAFETFDILGNVHRLTLTLRP